MARATLPSTTANPTVASMMTSTAAVASRNLSQSQSTGLSLRWRMTEVSLDRTPLSMP